MNYSTVFFDLDGTLYDNINGLWDAIRIRMGQYMVERLAFPEDKVHEVRRQYYLTYGTTLRGLQKNHQVDAYDFLAYVHDLPLKEYLQPAPEIRQMVLSMPQKRWIFTNADAPHAQRVLAEMQLSDCFDGIIDIHALRYTCKPEAEAYQIALEIAGNPDPSSCLMIDDTITNLSGARRFGIATVWISPNGDKEPDAQYTISEILELKQTLPELWQDGK